MKYQNLYLDGKEGDMSNLSSTITRPILQHDRFKDCPYCGHIIVVRGCNKLCTHCGYQSGCAD